MSKRVADFQLTSENYDLEEIRLGESGSKEKDAKSEEGDILESKEEIGARRMVRICKRRDDFGNVGSKLSPATVEGNSEVVSVSTCGGESNEGSLVRNNGEKNDLTEEDSREEKKEEEEKEEEKKEEEKKEEKKKEEEEKEEEKKEEEKKEEEEKEEEKKEEVLPFGNSGLSSSFKNPFVSLAASNENSNFLFSGFTGGSRSIIGTAGEEETAIAGGGEEEEVSEEPELENKVFTGEEHEETVYQCKNADLFMLRALESEEKSFRKLATGIIHLNIPKDGAVYEEKGASDGEGACKGEAGGDELVERVSRSTQPRIIFRQRGVYKVLLNSPLNPEISKTFQRNSNIRKGYAVNFIAIGQNSEIQQCMLRFQNESELVDFTDKVHQIVDQYYSKSD